MNGFTSGKRAQVGLPPANHDPKPFLDQWGIDRTPDGDPAGFDFDVRFGYSPRPEFDVPDNPILVAFRAGYMGMTAEEWLRHGLRLVRDYGGADRVQIEHARRVLTRLAALS